MRDRTTDTYYKKAVALSTKISHIKLHADREAPDQLALVSMKNGSAGLVDAIKEGYTRSDVNDSFHQLAASIDVAGILGVISQKDMKEYYKLIDDLWDEIDMRF
jgi:hypothetical protein